MNILYIEPNFKEKTGLFNDTDNFFEEAMKLDGEVVRALENRRTVRFEVQGRGYFIKQHFGIGWREIFKNLFQLRLPIISAKSEWLAISRLNQLHIPALTLVAYGERGVNPAKKQSFLMTEELTNKVSLEDLAKAWQIQKPTFKFKQALLREVATIARLMHQSGMNHRDFYLCHFLLKKDQIENLTAPGLHLILMDLHRAQIRKKVPRRWQVKDIAGLYFSSMDAFLTQRDLLRFLTLYFEKPWREILATKKEFLKLVRHRAVTLYHKTLSQLPGDSDED